MFFYLKPLYDKDDKNTYNLTTFEMQIGIIVASCCKKEEIIKQVIKKRLGRSELDT